METTSTRIACRVNLTSATLGHFNDNRPNIVRGVTVTSPRTGRTITVWDRAYNKIDRRIPCRVAGALARGVRVVEFSIEELRALKEAADAFLVSQPTGQPRKRIVYSKLSRPNFAAGAIRRR